MNDEINRPCSPYDEIIPTGFKGKGLVEPSEDTVWKVTLLPGTDNSFHQVGMPPACFSDDAKIEYLREYDKLAFIDVGNFEITLLITRSENITGFRAWASLLLLLKARAKAGAKETLENLWGLKILESGVACSALWDLNSVQRIELVSEGKTIDRMALGLYTEANAGVVGSESYWLVDQKALEDLVSCLAQVEYTAKQEIDLESRAHFLDSTWFGFLCKPESRVALGSEACLSSKVPGESSVGASALGLVCFNYDSFGYNEGVYQ